MPVTISVIIPVYNVEPYIQDCLRSVMNQTTTESVECLVVDDCSPDHSMDLAEQCLRDYCGKIDFRIIHREKNGGLSAARNTGVNAAKGEYLYFLDSDDSITPSCLEQLVLTARKYPKAQIIQAGARATRGFEYLSMVDNRKVPVYSDCHKIIKWRMLWTLYPATAWNKLIRRSWLLEHGLFFKEGLLHEDDHWNFFAAKYVTAYAVCRHDTYLYNIREGSITQSPGRKNIESWIVSLNDFLCNLDNDCTGAQRAAIYRMTVNCMIKCSEEYHPEFRRILRLLLPHCGFCGRAIVKEALRNVQSSKSFASLDNIRIKVLSRLV